MCHLNSFAIGFLKEIFKLCQSLVWRAGSAIKSTCFFYKDPALIPSILTVALCDCQLQLQMIQLLFLALRTHASTGYTYITQAHTHAQ